MLEIPQRIWKKIAGYTKPQKVFRTNHEHILCWKTTRRTDKKHVVIKLFEWDIIEESKEELKAVADLRRVNIPNLVKIYDIKEDDDLGVYYVMEYWGDDLREIIRTPPRQDWVIEVIKQLLQIIAELHRHKRAHRDIKPENIFIKEHQIKLGDYGLIKSQRVITQLATIAGTRDYMAPEILKGNPYDKRCDIYSAGIVLLELLTGVRELPAKKPSDISDSLWQVILKATAKEPDKRFSLAKEFIEGLKLKPSISTTLSITVQDENEGKQLKTLSSVNEIKEPIDQYDHSNIIRRSSNSNDKPDTLVETLWRQFPNADQTEPTAINKTIKIGEALLKATIGRFGTQHAEVADVLENLAQLQVKKSDYVSAEKLFQQLAQIDERLYGNSSLEVIDDTIHRAYVYVKMDRLSEAEILYNGALSRYRQMSRKPDLTLVTVMNNLAGVYYRQKKYLKAQELYHQALQTGEQLFKKKWPGRWSYLYNLALTYEAMSNKSAARPLRQQALTIAGKIMPPDDQRLKMMRDNLKE